MVADKMEELEERTKNVEEAIIKFEQIAEIIIVRHDKEIDENKKKLSELEKIINDTCDTKTHQIYKGDQHTLYKAIGAVVILFMLFVGALNWADNKHVMMQNKLDVRDEQFKVFLDKMDKKLDKATAQRYRISSTVRKDIVEKLQKDTPINKIIQNSSINAKE